MSSTEGSSTMETKKSKSLPSPPSLKAKKETRQEKEEQELQQIVTQVFDQPASSDIQDYITHAKIISVHELIDTGIQALSF